MLKQVTGSFRDPSGIVYFENGILYRQVNLYYKENYDFLFSSGLYDELISSGFMVSHIEVKGSEGPIYKIIKPETIPFVSYPYEWCFSQLKEAALLTLKIQRLALKYGMSLKDCSAYNVQFRGAKPVFIDTLSFEKYSQNIPWDAYRQFCQHFVAPLVLMGFVDVRLNQLLKSYIDGLPLDLVSSLLPLSSRFNINLLLHIYLHASAQTNSKNIPLLNEKVGSNKFSLNSFYGLIDSLESLLLRIKWKPKRNQWSTYYENGVSYTSEALSHKKRIVSGFLDKAKPNTVWDLGANTGVFSHVSAGKGIYTVFFDFDPACVESNYLTLSEEKEGENILPLLIDICNPTPGIGWEGQERMSFLERGPVDAVMMLALIHHLAIANNLPLEKISHLLRKICKWLIIEFVPKDDEMVKKLLVSRKDIFNNYTQEYFEKEFAKDFIINETVKINDSRRTLYLMRRKEE